MGLALSASLSRGIGQFREIWGLFYLHHCYTVTDNLEQILGLLYF